VSIQGLEVPTLIKKVPTNRMLRQKNYTITKDYIMSDQTVAARTRLPYPNDNNELSVKVPTDPVVRGQEVNRASSNLSLILDGVSFTLFCVGLMASSWIGCALSDVCTAANGGPF
jgi:hypothetical protein